MVDGWALAYGRNSNVYSYVKFNFDQLRTEKAFGN